MDNYGVYYDTINVYNVVPSQAGFSQPTSVSITTDNGQTFLGAYPGASFPAGSLSASKNIMTDPFPARADGTRFEVPYGSALGLVSRVGNNWDSGDYSY